MRPLHDINPARLEWIDRLASLSGKRVLDVGCGGGVLTEAMAQKSAFVTGIDLADKPLHVARLHALDSNARVEYRECAAETMAAEKPESFDVVTCMEMLEHVPEPEQTVRACATLVSPAAGCSFRQSIATPRHSRWQLSVRVCLESPAARHARIRKISKAKRACAIRTRGRTGSA